MGISYISWNRLQFGFYPEPSTHSRAQITKTRSDLVVLKDVDDRFGYFWGFGDSSGFHWTSSYLVSLLRV